MKRTLLHILFWLAYLIQDTVYAYLADNGRLVDVPVGERIWIATHICGALMLLKMTFTYLLLYVFIDNILKQRSRLWINIFYISVSVVVTLLIYRAMSVYYLAPATYGSRIPSQEYWRPTSFFFAIMDLGFVAAAAVVIHQIRRQMRDKVKEKTLLKEKLETELKFLKNQTNPHFLFNTLNNIYALARKKSDSTADVVMKLSKILRFMLYESGKEFITIEEEIKVIEDYIELEKIRYSERLDVSFKKEIDDNSQPLSPLLLLPFVENAFKHGISESFYDSFIDIKIVLRQGQLHFCIENTKEGESSKQAAGHKIGLENTRRQLQLMYSEYDLQVDDQPKLFKVDLTVNLNKYEKI